jgi:hypothetical protein
MALGWTAAAVALAAAGIMAFGFAALLLLASRLAAAILGGVAAIAWTLAGASALRAKKHNAQARVQLDDAWELVAEEVIRARGGTITAEELGSALRTESTHAEALLARLSAHGHVRVEVREDAELAYLLDDGKGEVRGDRERAR